MDFSISELNYNCVETIPGFETRAAFTVNSGAVFREDVDIIPTVVDQDLSFMPWGGDNLMPFNIIDLIEKFEKLATCQPANVSTPRSATDPACNTARPKPPQMSPEKSRTSFSITTTSRLAFSVYARISSTSASPYQCLFSTRTARASSVC